MKLNLLSVLFASSILLINSVSAQETFFGSLDSDVTYNNGVLIQGVTTTADGVAEVQLDGTGTLTVSNPAGGGFPRVMVIGGTKIISTRTYDAEEINKVSWSGQFNAPTSTVKPDFFDINPPGAGFATDYEAVEAFGMGLGNESFSFSLPAEAVFPVSASNGQKLYVATQKEDETWDVKMDEFCIVDNNLCFLELSSLNKVSLIKESFESCPTQNIANGNVGGTPSCIFSCNAGFMLNEAATGCVEAVGLEEFENQFAETTTETTTTAEQQIFENQIAAPLKEYVFPPGHFRYRASGDNFYRYFDEEGLDGDIWVDQNDGSTDMNERFRNSLRNDTDAGKARTTNMSFLSRNPRSAEEQLMAQGADKSMEEKAEDEEDFMSYLITMRNYFGPNAQENNYTAMSAEGAAESEEASEAAASGTAAAPAESGGAFLSSGSLLPSTGPGIFITIAVLGFALMMFGARRS
jgi:hypothetical protein